MYCWYLCTVITLVNNEINLYMKKCFFQTYKTAIFNFFEKLFYCCECRPQNINKNTCGFIFLLWNQKQPPEVFYKKALLKNFAIFTGKYLCWSLFLIKLLAFRAATIKKRLQHKCLPVNIAKYLRTPLLKNICECLLLMKHLLLHHK